eukprot:1104528-Alexandrium_andersonii.AAC.1
MGCAGHGIAAADARGREDEAHFAGTAGPGAPGALVAWRAGGPSLPPEPDVSGAALGTAHPGDTRGQGQNSAAVQQAARPARVAAPEAPPPPVRGGAGGLPVP